MAAVRQSGLVAAARRHVSLQGQSRGHGHFGGGIRIRHLLRVTEPKLVDYLRGLYQSHLCLTYLVTLQKPGIGHTARLCILGLVLLVELLAHNWVVGPHRREATRLVALQMLETGLLCDFGLHIEGELSLFVG